MITLATASVFPGALRQRLAGAALLAGLEPADVAALLEDGPHVCRIAAHVAGQLLLATGEAHAAGGAG